jgi:hypothetical protein
LRGRERHKIDDDDEDDDEHDEEESKLAPWLGPRAAKSAT